MKLLPVVRLGLSVLTVATLPTAAFAADRPPLPITAFAVSSDHSLYLGNSVTVNGPIGTNGSVFLAERVKTQDIVLKKEFRSSNLAIVNGNIVSGDGSIHVGMNGIVTGTIDAGKDVLLSSYVDAKGTVTARTGTADFIRKVTVGGNVLAQRDVKLNRDVLLKGTLGSNGSVTIADRTKVMGMITHKGAFKLMSDKPLQHQQGTVVIPAKDIYTLDTAPAVPASSGPSFLVREKQELALAPGSYGDIVLERNASLRLNWGTYSFKSIKGGYQGKLVLDLRNYDATKRMEILVSGDFRLARRSVTKIISDNSLTVPAGSKIAVGVNGAFEIEQDGVFYGTVVSQKELMLGKNVTLNGMLASKSGVVVGSYSNINWTKLN